MSGQRRIRDEIDGASVYYNVDSYASDSITGASIFDTARTLATNIATKLTGKAAKKIATKAVEKAVEKGAEKVGEKTGQLLGEKIYDRFNSKSSTEDLRSEKKRGDLIVKELQHEKPKHLNVKHVSHRQAPGETRSISQQFDDLLNLF